MWEALSFCPGIIGLLFPLSAITSYPSQTPNNLLTSLEVQASIILVWYHHSCSSEDCLGTTLLVYQWPWQRLIWYTACHNQIAGKSTSHVFTTKSIIYSYLKSLQSIYTSMFPYLLKTLPWVLFKYAWRERREASVVGTMNVAGISPSCIEEDRIGIVEEARVLVM